MAGDSIGLYDKIHIRYGILRQTPHIGAKYTQGFEIEILK